MNFEPQRPGYEAVHLGVEVEPGKRCYAESQSAEPLEQATRVKRGRRRGCWYGRHTAAGDKEAPVGQKAVERDYARPLKEGVNCQMEANVGRCILEPGRVNEMRRACQVGTLTQGIFCILALRDALARYSPKTTLNHQRSTT